MKKNLTLRLNVITIERAKSYAKANGTSLSGIVENYLLLLTAPVGETGNEGVEVTPLVKSLSGIASIPERYDFRSDYADYLIKKYK